MTYDQALLCVRATPKNKKLAIESETLFQTKIISFPTITIE